MRATRRSRGGVQRVLGGGLPLETLGSVELGAGEHHSDIDFVHVIPVDVPAAAARAPWWWRGGDGGGRRGQFQAHLAGVVCQAASGGGDGRRAALQWVLAAGGRSWLLAVGWLRAG